MARSLLLLELLGICLALLLSTSLSAPLESELETALVKRANSALYTLWKDIPASQIAQGDSALHFSIDHATSNEWGVTYLYGCTAIMISDPNNVVVGHLQQENGQGGNDCISINNAADVQAYINGPLLSATVLFDPGANTRVDIIYNNCNTQPTGAGIVALQNFLTGDGFGIAADKIFLQGYVGTGSGIGSPSPTSPNGLAVVQWEAGVSGFTLGTLKVFFGSTGGENPLAWTVFYADGTTP